MTECPVCYCAQATCKLTCGHQFCHSCVKEWYVKCTDTATCPMCRKNLHFKGLRQKAEKWNDEHREQLIQRVFDEMVGDVLEEVDDLTMHWLNFLSERFEEIRNCGWDLTEDDIDYYIYNDLEEEEDIYNNVIVFRDIPTWLIFFRALISQHPSRKSKRVKGPARKGQNDAPEPIIYIFV
jgi:hypothetical protein